MELFKHNIPHFPLDVNQLLRSCSIPPPRKNAEKEELIHHLCQISALPPPEYMRDFSQTVASQCLLW